MRLICLSWGEPSPGLGRLLAKEREFNKLQESGDKTIFTKVRRTFLGHAAALVCRRKPAPLTFPLPGGKGVRGIGLPTQSAKNLGKVGRVSHLIPAGF